MTPNLSAFLAVIRACEHSAADVASGECYRTLYGGSKFTSFADHPNKAITAGGYTSTAAGAYQILYSTWQGYVGATGPHDFSPDNQDLCARWLIGRRHATAAVEAGLIEQAIQLCSQEWASLPGSPYGQPTRSMDFCKQVYAANGGVGSGAPRKVQPTPAPFQPPPGQPIRKPMDSTKNVFRDVFAQLIPQAAKILLAGSPYGALADTVIETVVKATGAVNEQQAVEKMTDPVTGPAMVATATEAVITHPDISPLLEVGGGIVAAREADIKYIQTGVPLYKSPAFIISVILLVLPFLLAVDLFFVHATAYAEPLRTQIVTAILAVIMIVGGYFLGSSAGSAKKDETIDRAVK